MNILLALLAVPQEFGTITDVSLLADTVVSNMLMDERVALFSGTDAFEGTYQGFTGEFVAVEVNDKPIWFKTRDVDSILVYLPLHDRINYTRKDRLLVSLAGAAFLEVTSLAIMTAIDDEIRDKIDLPVLALSPVLGFALGQTQVSSPERHASPVKTRLFLMITAGGPAGEIKEPEE